MKRKIGTTALILAAALFLGFQGPAFAAGNQPSLEVEAARMGKLLPFLQKGLVIVVGIEPKDEDGLVYIDNLLWKNLTHVQKYELLQGIMAVYSVHNKTKGTHIKGAGAVDITSKEQLGLVNLETGKITIKK
jgi:hypothetical protein